MGLAVQLKDVWKAFKEPSGEHRSILSGLSLSIEPGALVRISGPSGAGKSTLLNLIAGLWIPDKGDVTVDSISLRTLSESQRDRFRSRNMAIIFQTFNLLSPLTVLENVIVPIQLATTARVSKADAHNVLDRLGLAGHESKRPWQLSVGQRQRVAVARALLMKPRLLLADEPTASLDQESSSRVAEIVADLHKQGVTICLASHDPIFDTLVPDERVELSGAEVRA